jgi:outer membrane receptor for ferrienterochelin and colicins
VITNMRAAYKIDKWGLTPFVGAKNLFDYVQAEKRLDDAAYIWAPWIGRVIYGGIELQF